MLLLRMIQVVKYQSKRIFESCHGLLEMDAMFSEIALGFRRLPLELHDSFYSTEIKNG